jgi:O-antigen/teichoic acid export membrane protein
MKRESMLAKNTIIYMLGNTSSKILAFFMLPIYTFYLSQSDVGNFDLIFNTAIVAIPIITICSQNSIFRFSIGESDQNTTNRVISNGIFIVIIGIFISSIPYIVFCLLYKLNNSVLILLFIITFAFANVWQQIARALQKNIVFAISGVLQTIITFFTSILFISVFNMKLEALILSYVISSLSIIIYTEWKLGIIKNLKLKHINKDLLKKMIAYSLPLLPGEISWWLMSGASRYIIFIYLGVNANGVFAVASKFPALIATINGVFNLAWTESSIIEFNSTDKNEFYTKTFNIFLRLQFSLFLISLPILKYLLQFMLQSSYDYSWIYIPFVLLSTVFTSFSNFYNTGFLGSKNTIGSFSTVGIAAVLNIILTFLLIQSLGLHAAGIANCASLLCLWLVRVNLTKKYFTIRIEYNMLLLYVVFVVLFIFGYYLDKLWLDALMFLFATIMGYITNKVFIRSIVGTLKQKIRFNQVNQNV